MEYKDIRLAMKYTRKMPFVREDLGKYTFSLFLSMDFLSHLASCAAHGST